MRTGIGHWLRGVWSDEHGQSVAEYAVLLAVILVVIVGTVRLVGANAKNIFSEAGSSIEASRSHGD